MKITVTLDSYEVTHLLMAHVREKFKDVLPKGEILEITRAGDQVAPVVLAVSSRLPSSGGRE